MNLTLATILLIGTIFVLIDGTTAWRYSYWDDWRWNQWRWNRWNRWSDWTRYWDRDYEPYWGKRDTIQENQRIDCTYLDGRSLLSCFTLNSTIDCEAYGNFVKYGSSYFNFYAISATRNGNLSKIQSVSYSLYPQLFDGRTWLNSTYTDPIVGNNYTYSLYWSLTNTLNGIRISNATCYGQLVNLFNSHKNTETIVIGSDYQLQERVIGGIMSA